MMIGGASYSILIDFCLRFDLNVFFRTSYLFALLCFFCVCLLFASVVCGCFVDKLTFAYASDHKPLFELVRSIELLVLGVKECGAFFVFRMQHSPWKLLMHLV